MQYKNNKKEKSIFAKTIEESKNEVSIDWVIRNSNTGYTPGIGGNGGSGIVIIRYRIP